MPAKPRTAHEEAVREATRQTFSLGPQLPVQHIINAYLDAMKARGWRMVRGVHDGRAGLTPEMCVAFWERFWWAEKKHGHYESTNAAFNALLNAAPDPRGKE